MQLTWGANAPEMEPNCNSVFLLPSSQCVLVGGHPALSGGKCGLVSRPLSSQVMGLAQTSSPNQHDQVKAVTKLLIRQHGPTSAFPRWAGFWLDSCHGNLLRLPSVLFLPWSFSPDLADQGGLAACSWPGRCWAVSLTCAVRWLLEVSSSITVGVLGWKVPYPMGPSGRDRALSQEGMGGLDAQGHCSCLAGEPCAFSSTGVFSCPHGSYRFIACRLPLSSASPQPGGSMSHRIWSPEHRWPWGCERQGDPSTAIPSEVCFHEHDTGPSISWHWLPSWGV